MNIMVTGGCGFIGGAFVRYLLKNTDANVINIDALTYAGLSPTTYDEYGDRYTFYNCKIGNVSDINNILETHRPDYIINFAAETHVDNSISNPHVFVDTNIVQTYHFFCTAREYSERYGLTKFLHVSTDEVYGQLQPNDPAFSENTPYNPNSPYSATKASSDHLLRSFHHTYGFPALITNCSNNYGPYQHPEKFIPKVIINALKNEKIPVYGNGMNIRDWLFVDDHCEALYIALMNGMPGDRYNIGGNNEHTNISIVNRILEIMGKSTDLISFVTDRKGHDFRYAIDNTLIGLKLNWRPAVSFEEGLEKTILWYTTNLQRFI